MKKRKVGENQDMVLWVTFGWFLERLHPVDFTGFVWLDIGTVEELL
jgi:hypothetical protein